METLSLGLPFMAAFLDPGGWGAEFAWFMDNYTRMAGMWLVGEDMPRETNRVTLNSGVKDKWGNPVPNVHFDDHENDIACAIMRTGRARRFTRLRARSRRSARRPTRRPTTWARAA